jgi:putative phosphoesterase
MIGIMADSHDNLHAVRRAVRLFNEKGCSLVIHAGDFVAPFSARELGNLSCPVKGVFGNCDGEKRGLKKAFRPLGEIKDAPLIFRHDGLNLLVIHLNSPLEPYLSSGEYDVLIFAHTHWPEIRKEKKTIIINPGETGGWLSGNSTVAVLDEKTIHAEIITLGAYRLVEV